jgi:hypothetical protein
LAVVFSIGWAAFAPGQGPGSWEAPFNHAVPASWNYQASAWDGEPQSPFTQPADPHRFLAGHMSLIPVGPHRGKVLVWNWMRMLPGQQYWSIVDVSGPTPVFQNFVLPMPGGEGELFCSGHSWTRDGHLLVAGGNRYVGNQLLANRLCYRFDPWAPTGNAMWVREPDLYYPRWYPTVTTLGSDQLLVSGGVLDIVPSPGNVGQSFQTYEVFDPIAAPGQGSWQANPNNPANEPFFAGPTSLSCEEQFFFYPRQFLLTSGKLFFAGMPETGYRLDHGVLAPGVPPLYEIQTISLAPYSRQYASAFLFPNLGAPFQDIVIRIGGFVRSFDCNDPFAAAQLINTNTTEYCFAGLASGDPAWNWNFGPAMTYARVHPDAVLLPNSSVLVHGGNLDLNELDTYLPVTTAELFNDLLYVFRPVAAASIRRGYHSTAVLLPDGRVLTAGGEQREMDYEVYRPPYLDNGTVRPAVVNPPSSLAMQYGSNYTLQFQSLPAGVTLDQVVLMAPGSITHHSDMNQRLVELPIVLLDEVNNQVTFTAPPNSNHAPRGHYMLFLISSAQGTFKGTPSEAIWAQLQ